MVLGLRLAYLVFILLVVFPSLKILARVIFKQKFNMQGFFALLLSLPLLFGFIHLDGFFLHFCLKVLFPIGIIFSYCIIKNFFYFLYNLISKHILHQKNRKSLKLANVVVLYLTLQIAVIALV